MTLISEIPAALVPIRPGGHPRSPGNALAVLASTFGPTLTYDFTFDGPVTQSKLFAHHRVYAIVLDRSSGVDEIAVRAAVERLALRVPVIILRSCTSHKALQQVRREVVARGRVGQPHTMGIGISDVNAEVSVTVNDAGFAEVLREQFGERVHVLVGQIYLN